MLAWACLTFAAAFMWIVKYYYEFVTNLENYFYYFTFLSIIILTLKNQEIKTDAV